MTHAQNSKCSRELEHDPVLSYCYIIKDLNISRATFFRNIQPSLPVMAVSDRRRGVRWSDYLAWKAARVRVT